MEEDTAEAAVPTVGAGDFTAAGVAGALMEAARFAPAGFPARGPTAGRRIAAAREVAATALGAPTAGLMAEAGDRPTQGHADFHLALRGRRAREARLPMGSGIPLEALAGEQEQPDQGHAALQMAALPGRGEWFAMPARRLQTASGIPSVANHQGG